MAYRIELKPSAARTLAKLSKDVQRRVAHRIDELARNPRPPGVEKLEGEAGFYRIRVGNYRIIYTIERKVLLILVVRIGHRREVYRGL